MQDFFFQKRGIYYRTNEFRQNRPTLVFVHGLSGSSSAWKKYETRFGKQFNVLTFDLRGHGKSAKPKTYEEYTIKHFVEDLYELTRHLGIERCILISHSFGALIGLGFLAEHSEMVTAAVFLSPHYAVGNMRLARAIRPFFSVVIRLLGPVSSSRAGGHIDYSQYLNTGDWNIRRMFADVSNTSLRVYLWVTKQSYEFDGENILKTIRIPVLIVHGKKDTIFPVENGIAMAAKIENSKLVLLDNADHIIVLNHDAKVTRAIEDFVGETQKQRH